MKTQDVSFVHHNILDLYDVPFHSDPFHLSQKTKFFHTFLYLQNYMSKYQGLPMSNDPNTRMALVSHTDLASTIRNMQRYMDVPLTGRIDGATKTKLTQPRCGVPDPSGQDTEGHALGGRMRRYAHTGGKWETHSLTFR